MDNRHWSWAGLSWRRAMTKRTSPSTCVCFWASVAFLLIARSSLAGEAANALTLGFTPHRPTWWNATRHLASTPAVLVNPYPFQYKSGAGTAVVHCCLPYTHGIGPANITSVHWHFQGQGNQTQTIRHLEDHPEGQLHIQSGQRNCSSVKAWKGINGYLTMLRRFELSQENTGRYWCSFDTTDGIFANFSDTSVKSYCSGNLHFRQNEGKPKPTYHVKYGQRLEVTCQLECGDFIFLSRLLRKADGSWNVTDDKDKEESGLHRGQNHLKEVFAKTWVFQRVTEDVAGSWYCDGGAIDEQLSVRFDITVEHVTGSLGVRVPARGHNGQQRVVQDKAESNNRAANISLPGIQGFRQETDLFVLINGGNRTSAADIRFRCRAVGVWEPMPELVWSRKNSKLEPAADIWNMTLRSKRAVLIQARRELTAGDLGEYVCAARNPYRELQQELSVTLHAGYAALITEADSIPHSIDFSSADSHLLARVDSFGMPMARLAVSVRINNIDLPTIDIPLVNEAGLRVKTIHKWTHFDIVLKIRRLPSLNGACEVALYATSNTETMLNQSLDVSLQLVAENAFGKSVHAKRTILREKPTGHELEFTYRCFGRDGGGQSSCDYYMMCSASFAPYHKLDIAWVRDGADANVSAIVDNSNGSHAASFLPLSEIKLRQLYGGYQCVMTWDDILDGNLTYSADVMYPEAKILINQQAVGKQIRIVDRDNPPLLQCKRTGSPLSNVTWKWMVNGRSMRHSGEELLLNFSDVADGTLLHLVCESENIVSMASHNVTIQVGEKVGPAGISSSSSSTTTLIAIIVATVVVSAFLLVVVCLVRCKLRSQAEDFRKQTIAQLMPAMFPQFEPPPPIFHRGSKELLPHQLSVSSLGEHAHPALSHSNTVVSLGSRDTRFEGLLPPDPEWDIPLKDISFGEEIGRGSYGVVYVGTMRRYVGKKPVVQNVAIKVPIDDISGDMNETLQEIKVLKRLGKHPHTNVVGLLGTCSINGGCLIFMELAERGSLLKMLRRRRGIANSIRNQMNQLASAAGSSLKQSTHSLALSGDGIRSPQLASPQDDTGSTATTSTQINSSPSSDMTSPSSAFGHSLDAQSAMLLKMKQRSVLTQPEDMLRPRDVFKFGRQIAKGMEFLASQRCVHRDLAARNILVCDDFRLKVSDFGHSRQVSDDLVYHRHTKRKEPIKWQALESLFEGIFTTQSDVWSYGIVLWEIVTLGCMPYPGVPYAGLFTLLNSGLRMPKPDGCSDQLYEMMQDCWQAAASERPTFTSLVTKMDTLLEAAALEADDIQYLELEDMMSEQSNSSSLSVSTISEKDEEEEADDDELAKKRRAEIAMKNECNRHRKNNQEVKLNVEMVTKADIMYSPVQSNATDVKPAVESSSGGTPSTKGEDGNLLSSQRQ